MAPEEPFQKSELPEPFSRTYLLVAMPESMEPLVPPNATSFLKEWEEMLDPKAAAAEAAREFLAGNEDWHVGDRFVEPTFTSADSIRKLLDEDSSVPEAFDRSNGHLHRRGEDIPISELSDTDPESRLPVLLGLAVLATLHQVGHAGRWLGKRYLADEDRITKVRIAATDRAQQRRAKAEEKRFDAAVPDYPPAD